MNKHEVVQMILARATPLAPQYDCATAFAPINIALCKYWGKRDVELHLPTTSSLSVTLAQKGTTTTLYVQRTWRQDKVFLNGKKLSSHTIFVKQIVDFLDLFRIKLRWCAAIDVRMNIPPAVGLASSACGFAALVLALNQLYSWNLALRELSMLARLGSGSAARSLWPGFVKWNRGHQPNGMDSYAEPLPYQWPGLFLGVLTFSKRKKVLSSRVAMQQTQQTSPYYATWLKQSLDDLSLLQQAIAEKNFLLFGQLIESNALGMHAMMHTSWPPICYNLPDSIAAMHRIWALRHAGVLVYFTQDAGPNLKLLCEGEETPAILKQYFPTIEIFPLF